MRVLGARRALQSLKLINRHALLLGPLLGLTFAIIAGWVATDYGAQYLFRDNEPLDSLGLCEHRLPCLWRSARLHTALYATALMGLVWTLFVLIERWDEDATQRHPVEQVDVVLPGVVLLGLVMVAASLFNRDEPARHVEVALVGLLGYGIGLVLVTLVTKLGLLLSSALGVHQMWTFLGLSALLSTGAAYLPVVTPAKAIFIALAAGVMIYCAFEIAKAHYRFPLALLIAAALLTGALTPKFKYQFAGLDDLYRQWPAQPDPAAKAATLARAPLIDPQQALQAWLARQPQTAGSARKLVVVAASGGAYRASFWSTLVLDGLTANAALPGFGDAVRLLTGASGGMVGNAYFAASRQPPAGATAADTGCPATAAPAPAPGLAWIRAHPNATVTDRLVDDLATRRQRFLVANSPTDSLTPVVQRLIGKDMLYAILPWPNLLDRGQVLENEWESLQLTFCDLEAGERAGWRPSLIVSPYLVESAKPMFISNLDLANIVNPRVALEFFREYPAARDRFRLATAVRMSATFPLISPAVRLPLPNRSRVVDAGYFDNFGITAAAMYLRSAPVRAFIEANRLQVILIRVLAYRDAEAAPPDTFWAKLEQGVEQITSPLEGALAARETRGQLANDLLLEDLAHLYPGRFHQFQFANATRASFSWHIQSRDLDAMRRSMADPGNDKELQRLIQIWNSKTP